MLHKTFQHLGSSKAKHYLDFISKSMTAKNVPYIRIIYCISIVFGMLFLYCISALNLIHNVFYFAQNIFKTILFCSAKYQQTAEFKSMQDVDSYPVYTILLPLYKESKNVAPLIEHLLKIEYPKSKLDIKLIVEEGDNLTIKAIQTLTLSSCFHLIKVPYSTPLTKPKAMNYALEYAIGEYLVIYDAEDRPELDQLTKVATKFASASSLEVCIQAKLNYYNRDENILTKLFSIEYSIWFDFFLKGLDTRALPIPLGGTSNHFITKVLKELGAWDAYNVTEDADLGTRLYLSGHRVSIIDSYTFEESPITIEAWMGQRARWIKGYIQTFLVYLRQRKEGRRNDLSIGITIWLFIGLVTYSFLLLPWLIAGTLLCESSFLHAMFIINSIFSLSYMYATAFIVLKENKKKVSNFTVQDITALILWPLYFLCHTVAAYKALYELLTEPFTWNKTEHGVSEYVNISAGGVPKGTEKRTTHTSDEDIKF